MWFVIPFVLKSSLLWERQKRPQEHQICLVKKNITEIYLGNNSGHIKHFLLLQRPPAQTHSIWNYSGINLPGASKLRKQTTEISVPTNFFLKLLFLYSSVPYTEHQLLRRSLNYLWNPTGLFTKYKTTYLLMPFSLPYNCNCYYLCCDFTDMTIASKRTFGSKNFILQKKELGIYLFIWNCRTFLGLVHKGLCSY